MDLLSEVIRTVRIGSAGSRLIRLTNEPGIAFPAFVGTGFHVVLAGTCWLIMEDEPPVALAPGDIVLTSSGTAHGLSRVRCPLDDLPLAEMGPIPPATGPAQLEFLCGSYRLDHGRAPQYLRALPDLIVVSPERDDHPELRALVDLLGADAPGARLGTEATLRALLDLVLVHALRQWRGNDDEAEWPQTGDAAIAAALRAIHDDPQRQWTVMQLSEVAGLPRTAFTRRFTAALGRPPMSYLISWRLDRGARLLRETDAPLATIAHQVGYSTEFAFAAAFRREYGTSPGRFRRTPPSTGAAADGRSSGPAGTR